MGTQPTVPPYIPPSAGRPKAVSIMGLGGGMGIGFEQAGFAMKATLEPNDVAGRAVRHNRPDLKHIVEDPEEWLNALEEIGMADVTLVYGSPPCQGVTGANAQAGPDNAKNDMFTHFVRAGVSTNVPHLVWENIPRFLSIARRHVDEAREMCLQAGYSFHVHYHNARDFGVSQNRRRVMFSAHKKPFVFPSHPRMRPPTVREVISDLADVEPVPNEDLVDNPQAKVEYAGEPLNDYQAALRSPMGWTSNHKLQPAPERFHDLEPGKQWTAQKDKSKWTEKDFARIEEGRIFNAAELMRLHPENIGRTVTGMKNKIHPWLPRIISLREASRLMAFPDWWEWVGSENWQQLAAGVCPPVCKWFGEVVLANEGAVPMPVPAGHLF